MCFIDMHVVKHVVSPYLLSLILESWSSKVLVSREYDGICTAGWMVLKFTGNFHVPVLSGMFLEFKHVLERYTLEARVM